MCAFITTSAAADAKTKLYASKNWLNEKFFTANCLFVSRWTDRRKKWEREKSLKFVIKKTHSIYF